MYFMWKTAPDMKKVVDAAPPDFGSIDTIGRVLFTDGLVPFELSSALLMVAIIGAVAVARGRHKGDVLTSTGLVEREKSAAAEEEVAT
jgi:NADH:ubiquinone oxidoreductase subunit 6 (subunit J)